MICPKCTTILKENGKAAYLEHRPKCFLCHGTNSVTSRTKKNFIKGKRVKALMEKLDVKIEDLAEAIDIPFFDLVGALQGSHGLDYNALTKAVRIYANEKDRTDSADQPDSGDGISPARDSSDDEDESVPAVGDPGLGTGSGNPGDDLN